MITYSNRQSIKLTDKFDLDVDNYAFYLSNDDDQCIDYTNVNNYRSIVDSKKRLKSKNLIEFHKYDIIKDDFNKSDAFKMLLKFDYIKIVN
jgi:hypothetical protein